MRGVGRVLVIVYAVMALGATGRSFVQIARAFDEAPLAYSLSAASAVVYIVATLALIGSGRPGWYRVAWVAIAFEMVGVLVVGTLSLTHPALFQHQTVWSQYGLGYVLIPLVLPMVGLWWLVTHRPSRSVPAVADAPAPSDGSVA
ncbi:hypothetical protein [Microbacterium sp. 13-71-7]|jgi:hypothetical protein|uniref:hypothetical protein n=1 Tax=Microbacterium sp. 13-71-7 TaxID=1970399 RepID=UPI0025D2643B|nr:hypothetical protein [Microbacterium sp. 13-71-7]